MEGGHTFELPHFLQIVYVEKSGNVVDAYGGRKIEGIQGMEEKIELFAMGSELFILSLPPQLQLVLERLQFEIISPVYENKEGLGVTEAHQMFPFLDLL